MLALQASVLESRQNNLPRREMMLFCLKWNSADPPLLSSCALQREEEVPWIFRVQWLSRLHLFKLLSKAKHLSRCQDPVGQSDLWCYQWHLSNVGRCLGMLLISAGLFLLDWVDDPHMAKALELQMCYTVWNSETKARGII